MVFDMRSYWWLMTVVCVVGGAGWRWPESVATLRIDTKVRFVDDTPRLHNDKRTTVQSDEDPYREASEAQAYYQQQAPYTNTQFTGVHQGSFPHQNNQGGAVGGSLTDLYQYCKCVSTPECNPRPESAIACGYGKYLCCFKQSSKTKQQNTEFFNEIEDERPMLFPGKENSRGPFPPPPGIDLAGVFGPGHSHETVVIGSLIDVNSAPKFSTRKPLLIGPGKPSGIIGPAPVEKLSGSATAQRGVLIGPGGPTGVIGPFNPNVNVGKQPRPVLVGPGGPTGIIGPRYGSQSIPVFPVGSNGIIRPGRHLLVGPGGPTGLIGPRYLGN